jgi:hypothetical protein
MRQKSIDSLWSNDMRTIITAAALIGFSATAGNALSVNVIGTQADFLAGKTVIASENFETGFSIGRSSAYKTNVGEFEAGGTTIGGQGLGISDGRDGRFNTTSGGILYLDSFDATHITWTLDLPSNATGLGFFMTDLDDSGGNTEMTLFSDFYADGEETFDLFNPSTGSTDLFSGNGNGKDIYVAIEFHGATVTKLAFKPNNSSDGVGFDDISAVAPVPLPAAAWMLIAGIGALFGLGRRKAAA